MPDQTFITWGLRATKCLVRRKLLAFFVFHHRLRSPADRCRRWDGRESPNFPSSALICRAWVVEIGCARTISPPMTSMYFNRLILQTTKMKMESPDRLRAHDARLFPLVVLCPRMSQGFVA